MRIPSTALPLLVLIGCSGADETSGNTAETPAPVTESGRLAGMTDAHNAERAVTAEGLQPLNWDPALAGIAQQHADRLARAGCQLAHSSAGDLGEPYGENLSKQATTSPDGPMSTPKDIVDGWVSEKDCYTFGQFDATDACTCEYGCGHYTQVVWRGTERLGCGAADCTDGEFNAEIWVCNYDPPGNFIAQEPY